jgi:hypothetical protein
MRTLLDRDAYAASRIGAPSSSRTFNDSTAPLAQDRDLEAPRSRSSSALGRFACSHRERTRDTRWPMEVREKHVAGLWTMARTGSARSGVSGRCSAQPHARRHCPQPCALHQAPSSLKFFSFVFVRRYKRGSGQSRLVVTQTTHKSADRHGRPPAQQSPIDEPRSTGTLSAS